MSADREREVDDRIADWVDGRLSDRDHERFVAELRVNPQLRRDLEEYERTVAAVRAALQAPTEKTQLADRVLATIAARRTAPVRGGSVLRWRPVLWSVATAAALLVVALLVDAWSAPPAPAKTTTTAQNDRKLELKDDRGSVDKPAEEKKSSRPVLDELLAKKDAAPAPVRSDEPVSSDEQERHEVAALTVTAVDGDGAAGESAGTTAAPPAAAGLPKSAPPAGRATGVAVPARRLDVETPREDAGAGNAVPAPDPTVQARQARQVDDLLETEAPSPATPAPAPEPVDPLPLVVVLGRAPAVEDLFRLRARKEAPAGGAVESKAGADDVGRRFDDFFTAQVAELAQVAAQAGVRAKTREGEQQRMPRGTTPPPEAGAVGAPWLQVAEVRLRRLESAADPATAEALPRGEAGAWVERDWLVEGGRQDVAMLLQRLAVFTGGADLQLRTGETTDVPAAKAPQPVVGAEVDAFGGQPATARQRIVLRFRLQAR